MRRWWLTLAHALMTGTLLATPLPGRLPTDDALATTPRGPHLSSAGRPPTRQIRLPAAQPTAVIQGLHDQVDAEGRFHSQAFPYTLILPWPPDGRPSTPPVDRFVSPATRTEGAAQRVVLISAYTAPPGETTTTLWQAAREQMEATGTRVDAQEAMRIAGQETQPLLTADTDGAYVLVLFVAARRCWLINLRSHHAERAADWAMLAHALKSFRLDPLTP